ncbi:hypothetical protein F4553_003339 [Allocatelliglobosispora scoriae]|uniref:Peptidase M23 n=1 Tax=Allocatelliglobosispora scoriae TaxID=643052 RepID=A0A841BT47_9ACTN|nr:hypothetical protein [Allocatelliglobosispora scoriae]MBB5869960.1 hypothetical protein [Allocatelliglobosispora scoriae]
MRGNGAHEANDVPRHRAEGQTLPRVSFKVLTSRKALVTAGLAGALAIAGAGTSMARSGSPAPTELAAVSADRADAADAANRSLDRSAAPSASASVAPKVSPSASPTAKPKATVKTNPAPVAGLDKTQMNNAAIIVEVARAMSMPKRAMIIAVATGMQESDLYNNASEAVPESLNYPHEGSSVDYDSVGVFQQRTSSGWGSIKNLMNPRYQARNFFNALKEIDWQNMSVTRAAQTVQVSAYPDAYAKHESRATTIVNAFF